MKLSCQEGIIPGRDLNERLDNLAKYGFEAIEFRGSDLFGRVEEILKATSGHQIKPSSISTGYRGCLLSNEKNEREIAISDIKRLLLIAKEIGALGLVTVPILWKPQINDLSPYKSRRQLEEELLVVLLRELSDYAKELNTFIFLEPLNRYETYLINTLQQAVDICKRVHSPNIRILADFFHMSIEERDISASIRAAGKYIYHAHLADSNRLLPGFGHTDFHAGFEALKSIGYKNYMAFEAGFPGEIREYLTSPERLINLKYRKLSQRPGNPEEALSFSVQYVKKLCRIVNFV
jgi:sugar phosphate isomerase/epimerase